MLDVLRERQGHSECPRLMVQLMLTLTSLLIQKDMLVGSEMDSFMVGFNRRSSEIQGTALGKSLQAWTCIYRSMPAGVAQSRHAFVGGTVSMWGR